jgi:hypothetical protein
MAHGGKNLRFALDHNFPAPVMQAFGLAMPNVELVAVATGQTRLSLEPLCFAAGGA